MAQPRTRSKSVKRPTKTSNAPSTQAKKQQRRSPTRKRPVRRKPTTRIPINDRPPLYERFSFNEAEPSAEQETPKASPFKPGMAPECMACPFGLFFYAVKNTKPEVMEHLMKGAYEMLQAGKAVFEQYTERFEQAEMLERITIS